MLISTTADLACGLVEDPEDANVNYAEKVDAPVSKMKHGGARPNSGGKREGSGRKPGEPNKLTKTIKEAIEASFDKVGGADYLARMADEQPVAYMALLAKVLPTQVKAELTTPKAITFRVVGNE